MAIDYTAVNHRPVKLWPQHRIPTGTGGKSLSIQGPLCQGCFLLHPQGQKTFWGSYSSCLASTSGQKAMLEENVYHRSSTSLCLVFWAWTRPNLRFNQGTRERGFHGFIWPILDSHPAKMRNSIRILFSMLLTLAPRGIYQGIHLGSAKAP